MSYCVPVNSVLLVLQVVEGFEHGLFEGDALVGVGVIGGEVDGGDIGRAGFVKGGDEGVVGGGEAVVGGDDEDGAGGEFRGEVGDVPGGGVRDDFFGEALGRAAGEGCHALGGEVGGEMAVASFS